ncbi:MAG: hypothetical protein FJ100_06470 [Deltaproteobacteria bacterium]|nr:hypothetical protein [Deltaproteobacteria bacterium]
MRLKSLSIAAVACLAISLPAGLVAQEFSTPRDWLDLRRGGAEAIVAGARAASAPVPWEATYAVRLPAHHPLARDGAKELRLTVARAQPATKSGAGGSLLVRIEAPAALKGTGLVVHGGKAWVRKAGAKAVVATPPDLFSDAAGVGVPWAAFGPFEMTGLHSATLEGEFGDIAVLRGKPEYVAGPAVAPVKAGVSKRHGCWVVGEVTDRHGKTLALVQWLEVAEIQGIPLPERVRLRGAAGEAGALDLRRQTLATGRAQPWGPRLLR